MPDWMAMELIRPTHTDSPALSDCYTDLVRPWVGQLLKLLKLDQVYEFARGDYLYYRERDQRVEVLDLLGGYGSTLLGHNHPVILNTLIENLRVGTPVHAQISIRKNSVLLAQELNVILQEEYPDLPKRKYICTLANTGAEAVEAAIKHALLEWKAKKEQVFFRSKSRAVNDAQPVMIAFEGSFHGKTAASVSATWNEDFRSMYSSSPVEVVFVRRDVSKVEIRALFDRFHICHSDHPQSPRFSRIAGVLFEPIQCEGGIYPLSQEVLGHFSVLAKENRVPLIADEIQTGLWRTGRFLVSSALGVQPDYLLLGKGLGGGLMKISALLVAEDHYQDHFGLIHTSTFAEDDLSSAAALTALRFLRADLPHVIKSAQRFEENFRERIGVLQQKYPGILREVRGKGFLLGIQFNFSGESSTPDFIYALNQTGFASYLIASYFLNRHRIRVGVTLSQPDTIRVEPSLFIQGRDVRRFLDAFEEVTRLLHEGKVLEMTRHFWRCPLETRHLEIRSPIKRRAVTESTDATVGFLSHVINPDHLKWVDPLFRPINSDERVRFLERFGPHSNPICFHEQRIAGANGRSVHAKFFGVFVDSVFFERSLKRKDMRALDRVRLMVALARKAGVSHLGLGQYTSIVSENGLMIMERDPQQMKVTTGNSLTAGFAFQSILRALEMRGKKIESCKIGVVGATGNIGNVLAQLLGDLAGELVLVYREPIEKSPKFQIAVDQILRESTISRDRLKASHRLEDLRDCDAVILGTNTVETILLPEHLKTAAVVLDISVPSNVGKRVLEERPDVECFQGGLARLPGNQSIETEWIPTPKGSTFACIAETLCTGLTARKDDFSIGHINKSRVLEALSMAESAGFTLGEARMLRFSG